MEYIEPNSERWLNTDDLPNEEWRDIKEYEGLYKISNYGRVKSVEKYVNTGIRHSTKRKIKEKICKLEFKNGSSPYLRIQLIKNGKYKHYSVHTLVLNSFNIEKYKFKYDLREDINNIDINKLEINHIDENIHNNCVDNLEWCTHLYNMNYGTRTIRAIHKANETKRRKKVECAKTMGL